jgi:hypothetical protein
LPPRKWGPGIPDLKNQRFFDFGEKLGSVEGEGYAVDDAVNNDSRIQRIDSKDEIRIDEPNKTVQAMPTGKSEYHRGSKAIQAGLRGMCFAIAVCAAIVSGTNSFEYFRTLRPNFIALLMAITMVGSGSLLPDLGVYLYQQQHRLVATFVSLCGILAISFCMVTTLAALYNTRTSRTEVSYANQKILTDNDKKANDARLETIRINGELERTNGLILSTQSKIDTIPTEDTLSDISQVLQGRLNRYLKDKKGYEDRLVVLQSILNKPVDSTIISRSDFYSFIAAIFHMDSSDKVEFFTGAIPSIFLEIVTPIMLGVALFL